MREREGRNGRFYGCSGYPNCKETMPLEVVDTQKRGESPQNASQAPNTRYDEDILKRLSVRLENIDLYLKKLSESYDALSIFFRTQQNNQGSSVSSEDDFERVGVRLQKRFSSQDVPTPKEDNQ